MGDKVAATFYGGSHPNSGRQWCLLHDMHMDDPDHPYNTRTCEHQLRDSTPEEEAALLQKFLRPRGPIVIASDEPFSYVPEDQAEAFKAWEFEVLKRCVENMPANGDCADFLHVVTNAMIDSRPRVDSSRVILEAFENPYLPEPPEDGKHVFAGSYRCHRCGVYNRPDVTTTKTVLDAPCEGRWAHSGKMRYAADQRWISEKSK
jgi:hypothetical protein